MTPPLLQAHTSGFLTVRLIEQTSQRHLQLAAVSLVICCPLFVLSMNLTDGQLLDIAPLSHPAESSLNS